MQSVCCRQHLLREQDADDKSEKNQSTIYDLWDTDRPARSLVGTDYEEFIFQRRMLHIIDEHAATIEQLQREKQQPLFLFYAPHVAHCPLQVPQAYLDQFDFMDNDEELCKAQTKNILSPDKQSPLYSCRKQYHAMVKVLDDILGSLVDRLKHHGLWENTLMVVTSDNGGPVDPEESGATNYPLRGGKYSDWEGGVRATAFVSGGYIPENRRGKIVRHPIHICDWYATIPALSGIDVKEEESISTDDQRVPPVDAVDVWPLIMGEYDKQPGDERSVLDHTPTRMEIPLSKNALIVGEWKLIWNTKKNVTRSGWTSPDYPNSHTKRHEIDDQYTNCTTGCLFNLEKDPSEHHNLASQEVLQLESMMKRLEVLRQGFFENDDRGVDSCPKGYRDREDPLPCACWMAVNYYGGFFGPYQEVNVSKSLDTSVS